MACQASGSNVRIIHRRVALYPAEVLRLDMVDKSTSPLQTHFGPVFSDEAVQTGLLFPE